MPALEIPAQIRLPAMQGKQTHPLARSTMANSQVLDFLLPQLFSQHLKPTKQHKMLENVDDYMLQETKEVYARINSFCQRLGINVQLEIRLNPIGDELQVFGESQHCKTLSEFINSDHWLKGALSWLQPNYLMLAQSLEMISFSHAYKHSPSHALGEFGYVDQVNNAMEFYLKCGNCPVELVTESPLHIYTLAS
ncbi:hypothetical protein [Paraglaciecola sp. MB-3u-78]|uniref:hypothetical protein n=1 Tax=Paraglaciecola sp. MB-3u-78 TaxID=2058332 RepID=UPI000C337C28|nr:hypothetical protein [Paraglaciecola sp. MB-3u-78]PKG97514.1 hypothetical protein CXF95_19440 [Paraglaciecola sp. MB-3u-78]